jgi:integrase
MIELGRITSDLPSTWAAFLRDWDRSLRAGNYPETNRYSYLLAAAQLARFLAEERVRLDAQDAAEDPVAITQAQVEEFQAWMVVTRSAATALNKHKCLQQFFKWLLIEQEIDRSPMQRIRQPKTPRTLIPIIRDEDTKKVLDACRGPGFMQLRDEAIVRLLYNTGARLSEVANLRLADVDLDRDCVHYHGKGAKDRRVRFGPRTGRALSRYVRARTSQAGSLNSKSSMSGAVSAVARSRPASAASVRWSGVDLACGRGRVSPIARICAPVSRIASRRLLNSALTRCARSCAAAGPA